jgi:hypothetical protein
MDDAVVRKFLDIFEREEDWERSRRHARRAGLMIVLNQYKDHYYLTGVRYDTKAFVTQSVKAMA